MDLRQKFPLSGFNGYYADVAMTYEVYLWIKDLEMKEIQARQAAQGWQQRTVYYKQLLYGQRNIMTEFFDLEEKNKVLIEMVKMVEDHRLMPHQHYDPHTKLCCLTERASETLIKVGVKKDG